MYNRSHNFKFYAKEAKNRLIQNNSVYEDEEIYFINSHKLTKQEIDRINEIAAEVALSPEFIKDPLGRLLDNSGYYSLDDSSKTKYLLDLSKIYLEIRKKYIK